MGQSDMGRCNALLLSGAGPISPDSDPESPPRAGATAQSAFPTFPSSPASALRPTFAARGPENCNSLPGLDTFRSIPSYITDKFLLVLQRQN